MTLYGGRQIKLYGGRHIICASNYYLMWHQSASVALHLIKEIKMYSYYLLTPCIEFALLSDAIHMARAHRQNAIQCLNACNI